MVLPPVLPVARAMVPAAAGAARAATVAWPRVGPVAVAETAAVLPAAPVDLVATQMAALAATLVEPREAWVGVAVMQAWQPAAWAAAAALAVVALPVAWQTEAAPVRTPTAAVRQQMAAAQDPRVAA